MKIALVTDSTCDLPADILATREIVVTPLHIVWDKQSFTDGVDMTNEIFYERLAHDPMMPKTSQPSPGEFVEKFKEAREKYKADAVVCITISSALSGTFRSAEAAKTAVDFPVHLVDSGTASLGLGFVVLAAANVRDRGGSIEEITSAATEAAKSAQVYFTPDTLEYLHRGGRIGGARRFFGTALKIKPILQVKEGVVHAPETVRIRKRAVARLEEIITEQGRGSGLLWLGVVHTYAPELPDVVQQLQNTLKPDMIVQNICCPTIGVHIGPGAIGIARLSWQPKG